MMESENGEQVSGQPDRKESRSAGIVTRRGFVGGAAVGALGAVTAGASNASARPPSDRWQRGASRPSRRVDVAVIGGGLAGMVAARKIASSGRSVVVLEARDRVGGRLKEWACGMPPPCDCGMLVAPQHSRVRELAKEFGVSLYDQHAVVTGQGNDVAYVSGQRNEVPSGGPLNSHSLVPLLADARIPFSELDAMAASVPAASPWEAAKASQWDAMTLESWKEQNTISAFGQLWIDMLALLIASTDASALSLLHVLAYLARLGDGRHGTSEALDFFFSGSFVIGGIQQIPIRLAKLLGRRVLLNTPVRRVIQRGGRVRIESDNRAVSAKRVIVATAPALNPLIEFDPPLPAQRAQLNERYPQGSGAVDVCLIYERPFWRDKGLTGRAIGLEPFFTLTDYSPPNSPTGRLLAGTVGIQQQRYSALPADERSRLLFDNLVSYVGEEARHPIAMIERNWTGPVPIDAPWVDRLDAQWTRGCPGFLPPGVLIGFGPAIRQPVGHIHWTSTEHSVSYNTYMEGAIRSAEDVAAEVLATL